MLPLPLSLPSRWVPPLWLCPPSQFLGPAFLVVVPRCLACPGAPDQVSDDGIPFLVCMSLPPLGLLPVLLPLPCLSTLMMKFPFHASLTVLLWFRALVMLRFLSCTQAFLALNPPLHILLFALNLPCRLAADALSGMLNTDLLLVPLQSRLVCRPCHGDIIIAVCNVGH
jgi:hypothetical protein